jgi:formyl-CoA transferase
MGFKMKGSDSMGFLNMNRNKRSVALNLKSKAGKQVFFELVKTADILVENYRPGVMKKLGIDYAVLKDINPGLVYASISGFGQTGPWAERPGPGHVGRHERHRLSRWPARKGRCSGC